MYTKFPMVHFNLNVFTWTRADGISPQINSTYTHTRPLKPHNFQHNLSFFCSTNFDTYALLCPNIPIQSAILCYESNVAQLWLRKKLVTPKVKPLNVIRCLHCFDLHFIFCAVKHLYSWCSAFIDANFIVNSYVFVIALNGFRWFSCQW